MLGQNSVVGSVAIGIAAAMFLCFLSLVDKTANLFMLHGTFFCCKCFPQQVLIALKNMRFASI